MMMKKTSVVSDSAPPPDPSGDGVTHINVHYNHSKTQLGRQLSPYYVARFQHPYFGPFRCIEGFALYIRTGCQCDDFRNQTGAQATQFYRQQTHDNKLVNREIDPVLWQRVLASALYAKFQHNPVIAEQFVASTLPFEQYFLWGTGKVPIRPKDWNVLTISLTTLRELMKAGKEPEPISDAEYASLMVR